MTRPDLGVLLALGYQEFVRELHADLATHGYDDLGRSDGYVFRTLAAGPLTTSGLASRLGISKQGAGQIVDDMTSRGYLESRPDPNDARARLLVLSGRGRGALEAARDFHRRYERRLVRRHGRPAVEAVLAVLGDMAPEGADDVDPRLRAMQL